ncbi:glycoside hydrolase superfamily, partial [Aspergillus pseudocaelatus]
SGSIISSTSDFKTFWKTVAGEFASNEKVIFDTNNEYHDMEQSLVLSLNQAAIDGIRAAGATTQYIFVEGNSYSGAWKWADTNDNLSQLTDPQDKIVYEMHQYLDSDGSGTSETCASSTIGKERLQTATQWLKTNNKKGFLGEFAGGVNEQCEQAVEGLLSYMSDNSDVWMGAEWWSAGPWWGSYMYSLEPTDGTAYSTYLPILKKYFVDGTGASSSATSAVPSTAAATTSTSASASTASASSSTVSAVESSSTSSVAEAPSTTSEVAAATPTPSHPAPQPTSNSSSTSSDAPASSAPTTLSTSQACGYHTTVTVTASRSTAAPSSSASAVPHYYQCGGINYSGPTTCESGYTCVKQNPYYSQCL